ncbi:hypothetical protein CYMTET_27870 [Cymbomonas tetramitiformis]|uniref:WDR36/Utp21 N-terminal domain-containing protein n=1 Tax=Cymbomonas tetramitiformis TaxID=36881 RepID=A0AAE0FQH9_9CHLO|nr:hypothetical protein CYMTET_27870 [Cymbomonas tetramitiformis]
MALFQPFRALGYVADDVPFAINRRGKEHFVTISVGKAWQIYNCAKITLVFVGPQLEKRIRALACKGDLTYAASGKNIVVSKRAKVEGTWSGHTGKVNFILALSDYVLSLGEDSRLLVWQSGNYDGPVKDMQLPEGVTPSAIAHPPTYLNKVVVGSEEGPLYLYNFSSEKLIYTFKYAPGAVPPAE